MQQSNTSHNKISFGGILQPLVESLERNPRQEGRLSGHDIVMRERDDIKAIIALDAENDIHLLISPAGEEVTKLANLGLKGLKVTNTKWAVAGRPAQVYLDIHCLTGIMPFFRRPFLRFSEDVLYEVAGSDMLPADAIYRTCFRWRKFWSQDIETEVTREWVHGLFGELLFLTELIKLYGPDVIYSWAGPLAKDHDFQRGVDIAAEVKTSVGMPFTIICNLRQLDPDIFRRLYVICYRLSPQDNGTTLPDIVRRIEKLLENYDIQLDKFYELLIATGYTVQLETKYNEFGLEYSEAVIFKVDNSFPKIIEKSFVSPPDHRISAIKYTLQLTGLKEFTISDIKPELKLFIK